MSDQQLPPPAWPSSEPSPDGPSRSSGPATPPAPGAPPPPTEPAAPPTEGPWSIPGAPGAGASGPPPPGGTPNGWAPPPTSPPSRRKWWILGAVVLVVLVGTGLGLQLAPAGTDEAGTEGSASVGDDPAGSDTDPGTSATDPGGDEQATPEPPPDPDDPGDFEPAVAEAHRDLFATIDESERTMIELQQAMPSEPVGDLGDDEVTAFRDRAGELAGRLEDLHDELEGFDDAGSADVTAIREQYLLHLQDWVDWSSALADDPTLLDRPAAAAPYSQAINDSAGFFADAVSDNLDRDRAPSDVVALADEIIERGFDSGDDGGTEI